MNKVAVAVIVAALIIAGMMLFLSNQAHDRHCEDIQFSDPVAWSRECA